MIGKKKNICEYGKKNCAENRLSRTSIRYIYRRRGQCKKGLNSGKLVLLECKMHFKWGKIKECGKIAIFAQWRESFSFIAP